MLKNKDFRYSGLKTVLASFAFCLILILPLLVNSSARVSADQPAAAASAGSADDPLVTLSYIQKTFVPQISKTIDSAIDKAIADSLKSANDKTWELEETIKQLEAKIKQLESAEPSSAAPPVQNTYNYVMSDAASSAYMVVELTKGQKLRAKSGSLELILRPGGTASVISPHQTQGLSDLTSGDELLNNTSVPVNHSLLIPRDDGRGIEITSVIAYVMVRGDYEIFE